MPAGDFATYATVGFTALSAFATVATAVAAWCALRTAKDQLADAKETRVSTNRAYMIAHYKQPNKEYAPLSVEIVNTGRTPAHDVSFQFSPELPSPTPAEVNALCKDTITYHGTTTIDRVNRFMLGRTFATWAPGHSVPYALWTPYINSEEAGASAEGIPADQTLIIRYSDGDGNKYEDEYVLDALAWFADAIEYNELEKIRTVLEKIANS
ncbi:hypothetical protein ACFWGD_02820 [Corynebacterium sp. NPDC060344]|uniref:hypothetical protein n=1 Tax=Corynebacterium sp. NPDC060344 TaxID=3347101 RepID=UPI003664702F